MAVIIGPYRCSVPDSSGEEQDWRHVSHKACETVSASDCKKSPALDVQSNPNNVIQTDTNQQINLQHGFDIRASSSARHVVVLRSEGRLP